MKRLYNRLNESIIDRYGLGKVIRQYGFYPSFLPITITGEHGPSLLDNLISEALEKKIPYYFFLSPRKAGFDFKNKKPVRHPSPFVWYRRKNNIIKHTNAQGSVFFLAHSTTLIKSQFNFDRIVEEIKMLPEDFFPVRFCLHFNDVKEELTNLIESNGYEWFCLARNYNENQLKNFYSVIPGFKYALGNSFTSGLLYCTEMGIPTSLICMEDVRYINEGNPQYKTGPLEKGTGTAQIKSIAVFNAIRREITPEQVQFAHEELGLDLIDSLPTRLKVAYSLYFSLFYCCLRLLVDAARNRLKKRFS